MTTRRRRDVAVVSAAAASLGAAIVYWTSTNSNESVPEQLVQKTVADSSIVYTQKVLPEHCDENRRMYGGELLKLIDVAGGLVAARHAGGPCLTISAERIIFLQPIYVGDLVIMSSAVNRSWGSSMEIGLRVMKESVTTGETSYCCHAYLTFVAKSSIAPPPSFLSTLATAIRWSPPSPTHIKAQVPIILPLSTLESKRYLLAGRRRAQRTLGRTESAPLRTGFRAQLLALAAAQALSEHETGDTTDETIGAVEKELLTEAYLRKDPIARVENGMVIAEIEGYMTPITMKLSEIEALSTKKGQGGFRKLSLPKSKDVDNMSAPRVRSLPKSKDVDNMSAARVRKDDLYEAREAIKMASTLVMSVWIVRPQHCNSKSILFGGTLMRWLEEVSSISARRVANVPWCSAAIDGLTFMDSVLPGEVVYVRACVTKVFDSSVECYTIAHAEDRNSPTPTLRLISEAFFTLVAIDKSSGRPLKDRLRHIIVPAGTPAEEIVRGADKRREERLTDKRILERVYA